MSDFTAPMECSSGARTGCAAEQAEVAGRVQTLVDDDLERLDHLLERARAPRTARARRRRCRPRRAARHRETAGCSASCFSAPKFTDARLASTFYVRRRCRHGSSGREKWSKEQWSESSSPWRSPRRSRARFFHALRLPRRVPDDVPDGFARRRLVASRAASRDFLQVARRAAGDFFRKKPSPPPLLLGRLGRLQLLLRPALSARELCLWAPPPRPSSPSPPGAPPSAPPWRLWRRLSPPPPPPPPAADAAGVPLEAMEEASEARVWRLPPAARITGLGVDARSVAGSKPAGLSDGVFSRARRARRVRVRVPPRA